MLLIAGPIAAHADTTTATESFSTQGTIEAASWTGSISLPDFDSSLGTLESVSLTLTLTDNAQIQVFNIASVAQSFESASLTFEGTLTAPGLVLAPLINSTVDSGVAQPGMNSFSTGPLTQTITSTAAPLSLSLWEDQTGGFVNMSYTKGNPTFQGTDVSGQDLLFGGNLTGTGTVTVEYTYAAIDGTLATPEPAGRFLSELAAAAMLLLIVLRARLLRS